ncbi:C2C4C protein, partial [Geococcyx californianus]|nr:C2C4C protein [Geococcyx californianus]
MWFLERIRASPDNTELPSGSFPAPPAGPSPPEKARPAAATFPNVLTPDRIPEFCIPPRLGGASPAGAPGSPQERARPARGPGSLPHLIQVESAEESPAREGESTNSDPQSQAALSLPHFLGARTCYGFCTLRESPHTRRKESLFLGDARSAPPALLPPRARASTFGGRGSASRPIAIGRAPARLPPGHPPCDSDTASSSDSSPFGSPRLGRSAPRPGSPGAARGQEGLLCRALRGRSRAGLARNNSVSTEESSSSDNSPRAARRASEGLLTARSFSLSCSPIFPLELSCSRERLVGDSTVAMDRGGRLRLSAEYCAENQRLRIRLISAEGLYEDSVEPKSINCCITFSLVPGKTQKQRSTVIKRSRNPIFNEDFFFDGIAEEELYNLSVRMKAVNKGCNMKRDYTLGERELSLMSMLSV